MADTSQASRSEEAGPFAERWSKDAVKFYKKKLDGKQREDWDKAIDRLLDDPENAPGVKALTKNLKGLWRLRVGKVRLIYEINREDRAVEFITMDFRGDVYE